MKYFWTILSVVSLIGFLIVYLYYLDNGVKAGEEIKMLLFALLFVGVFLLSLLAPNKGAYKCIMCSQSCDYEELYDNTVKGYGEICNNCAARRKRNQL